MIDAGVFVLLCAGVIPWLSLANKPTSFGRRCLFVLGIGAASFAMIAVGLVGPVPFAGQDAILLVTLLVLLPTSVVQAIVRSFATKTHPVLIFVAGVVTYLTVVAFVLFVSFLTFSEYAQ